MIAAQHVIKDDSWRGLNFSTWDKESVWPEKVEMKTINTIKLSIKEVAEQVARWILRI